MKNVTKPSTAIICLLTLLGVVSTSCTNEAESSGEKIDTPIVTPGDNSETSLDWDGRYKGVVPCADCEGIETELVLNKDKTYAIKTSYLGKGPGINQTGNFSWNHAGSIITLEGFTDSPNQYFVGENRIIQLDLSGKKVTGAMADKYVLVKQ